VKPAVEIDLEPDAPPAIADAGPDVPGLRLNAGGARADGRHWRLLVLRAWPDLTQTKRIAAGLAQEAQLAGDTASLLRQGDRSEAGRLLAEIGEESPAAPLSLPSS
jgi:hypothetical protein